MSDALTITEAEAAGLSELAALDLAMARDFAARAQAAEDANVANALARSYQRMARSYRQSLALKAKLRLDTQAAERETPRRFEGHAIAPPRFSAEEDARIDARAEQLFDAVERVIWAEHEPTEGADFDPEDDVVGDLIDRLDARLTAELGEPGFGRQPLDDHVVAVCRALGLSLDLARGWRELPEPGFGDLADTPPPEPRDSG